MLDVQGTVAAFCTVSGAYASVCEVLDYSQQTDVVAFQLAHLSLEILRASQADCELVWCCSSHGGIGVHRFRNAVGGACLGGEQD